MCEHCCKRSSNALHAAGDFRCLDCCAHLVAKAMPGRARAAAMLAAVDRAITRLPVTFTRHDVWERAKQLHRQRRRCDERNPRY